MHCTKNAKQIIPEMKLRGLIHNFYILVAVSDLYIFTIGPLFCCIEFADRLWGYTNRSKILEGRNWEKGRAVPFLGIFVSSFQCSVEKRGGGEVQGGNDKKNMDNSQEN